MKQRRKIGQKIGATGFRGIRHHARLTSNPWSARVMINYKPVHLGYFATATEAAKAYDSKLRQLFGEVEGLNFPLKPYGPQLVYIEEQIRGVILLTRGKIAVVDDHDYDRVNARQWHAVKQNKTWYAAGGKNHRLALHRFILDAVDGQIIDHKNGDGLDNRRSNLRFASQAQNQQNQIGLVATNTSGYRGVQLHRQVRHRVKCWLAAIQKNKKKYSLGLHASPESAARAYDAKARELFGEFARLNFPEQGEQGVHVVPPEAIAASEKRKKARAA